MKTATDKIGISGAASAWRGGRTVLFFPTIRNLFLRLRGAAA